MIHTLVKIFHRRSKGQSNKVMARRVEQVPPVRRVDIEENAGNHNCLLLEQLLKECEAVVERGWQFLKVEPDVKCAGGGNIDVQAKVVKTLEDMVALHLEVLLQRHFSLLDVVRLNKFDSSQLHRVVSASVKE